MSARPLYRAHNRALTLLYTEIEEAALGQAEVFVGTAGSVIERTNASSFRYYAHQSYDASGVQRERYVAGPVGDPDAETKVDALRAKIQEVKDLVPTLRMLGREGFHLVDRKTYATLAALHNRGVFSAGGILIGSHAYGVLLNRLGARATPYSTEDIDIARGKALAFDTIDQPEFIDILRESGIDFVQVPALNKKEPPTSFKQKGRARFHVDLLVPSSGEAYPTVAVPELAAHATGLPYLGYLLADSHTAVVMAREGCCAVRVPVPERFAVHKLIVSQLRTGPSAKARNDLQQAAVLCAALGDNHPGAIEAAAAAIPRRATKRFKASLASLRPLLEQAAPRAWEEIAPGGS